MKEIIPAEDSHIPEILQLWEEFMDFHKNLDPRFPLREDAKEKFENHLREMIDSENSIVLCAVNNTGIVGFAIAQKSNYPPIFDREDIGIIDSIFVGSSYRERGIGMTFLNRLYDWFDTLNISRIELSVAAHNTVGYSFWRKHGFKDYVHRLYLDR